MAHDIQQKVQLTPEEYLAAKMLAEYIGTSISGLLRMLLKEKIRAHVASIGRSGEKTTDEMGHE